MKKKTKSRSSNSLLGAFIAAVIVCLIGAGVSTYFFVENYFMTLRLDEDPIATISFKYKTAQRKFMKRTIWDRLKQESPLYNGDTIHTSDLSEATITFIDGNRMILNESTMAQIFLKEDGNASASLQSGEAQVDASDSENGFILTYGESVLDVTGGSSANAALDSSGNIKIQVLSGNVSITDKNGLLHQVSEGDAVDVSENGVAEPAIIVTNPSPNQKIIYHTQGDCNVNFSARTENLPAGSKMILQFASDKKFKNIISSEEMNASGRKSVTKTPGNYYWRIRVVNEDESEIMSISSKINITQALPPVPVTPVVGYEATYRTKIPAIRFVWKEVPLAQNYRLTISTNPKMTNPVITQRLTSASCIISTLEEGKYYWQVTPFFAVNGEGFAASSEIYSFDVVKMGNLIKPVLYVPANDGIVNIDKSADNTAFSWRMDNEAAKYTLIVADNANLSNPVYKIDTTENFVSLKANSKLSEGKWYWGVSFSDFEGNQSPVSKVHSFYALNGNPEQRIVQPGNGYQVSENLLPDLQFTWKKNLPASFESELQIASDADFNSIISRFDGSGYNYSGITLPVGTYYWRLHSYSNADNMTLDTPAKSFRVVGNLGSSTLLDPSGKAIARENKRYNIKWSPVPEADFYKVEMFRVSTGEMVYSDNVYDTNTTLDLYYGKGFVDKENYRIEIQARTNAVPGVSSRRVGRITESTFNLVKLKPVQILSPELDKVIEGVEAALNKIKITWDAVDKVREAQIVVYKVEGSEKVPVLKIPEDDIYDDEGNLISKASSKIADKTVYIENPDLKNGGNFEIIVYAKTLDGIDISNTDPKRVGRFKLTPVEPLPKALGLSSYPEILDTEYLKNRSNPRTIKLQWSPVTGATEYIVRIVKDFGKKKAVELGKFTTGKASYDLAWMDIITSQKSDKERNDLYQGTFTFTVEAIRKIDNDGDGVKETVLQQGELANGQFKTDVPKPSKTKIKDVSNAYSNSTE